MMKDIIMNFIPSILKTDIKAMFHIVIAIIIFLIPSVYHRLNKKAYTPVYFIFYPFSDLNEKLSIYLGEDFDISDLNEEELKSLKRKLIIKSVISVCISTILIPLIVGGSSALYMDINTFSKLIFIYTGYNIFICSMSIKNFGYYTISKKGNRIILATIYVIYIWTVYYVCSKVYTFVYLYAGISDWAGLFSATTELIIGKFIVPGVLLASLTTFLTDRITNREFRRNN